MMIIYIKRQIYHRLLLLGVMICCITTIATAQEDITVAGKVSTEKGESVPGVSVLVKGTTQGAVTNSSGSYSIKVPNGNGTLVFTYVGFNTKEVAVNGQKTLNVLLSENIGSLEELVVVGYGAKKKKDLTGSISSITSKDIENTPFASPEFALQGKTSGVRVVNSSGNPSAAPNIYIRGIGTWNGSSQPLYVIDGQIITPQTNESQDLIGSINLWSLISPNDIESMSVLKDASSAAIYGSRGANGVILITTKKGVKGKPVLEFNSQYGTQNVPQFDVLNSQQLIALNREMFANNASPDISLENDLYGRDQADLNTLLNNYSPQMDPTSSYYLGDNPQSYSWQPELIHKNAVNQSYNFKVSGASEAADYYISTGYNKQESVLRGDDLERFSLTMNVNTDIGKYLRTGINYRLVRQTSIENSDVNLQEAASYLPWQPIYDPTNMYGFNMPVAPYFQGSDWNPVRRYGVGTRNNFFATRSLNIKDFNLLRNMGQGFLEFKPIAGLVVKAALSVDWTYQQRKLFNNVEAEKFKTNGQDPTSFGNGNSKGMFGLRTNKFLNYQADYSISYNKAIGKHAFNGLAAIQDQYHTQINEDLSSDNISSDDPDDLSIANEKGFVTGFSGTNQRKYWFGYIGRLGYNYASTYYVDLSFRRDASNGFPPKNRYGNFYSASGAWRISSESFMKDFKFINDLKLRGGWGQAGNDEAVVGNYAFLSGISAQGTYGLGSGNGDPIGHYNLGITVPGFPNTDLSWETVTTTYGGLEATLFDSKISFNMEVYKRITNDILQYVNLPYTVGTNNPAFNIGTLQNTGVDLELSYNGKYRDFNYSIGGNISFVKNKVLDLYDHAPLNTSYGRVEEGKPIGNLWGYKAGGIFQNQAEIDQYFANFNDANITDKTLVRPGDMYFLDVHGNPTTEEPYYSKTPDGKINSFDQTDLGSVIPAYTYGLNLSLNWKGIDASLNFYGEGDVQKVNGVRQSLETMAYTGINQSVSVLNHWTPQNPSTTMPRAVYGDPAGNNRFSSRWIESAAFLRLNTWQLGYSFSDKLLQKTNLVNKLRVFVGGQNNLLITNWSGIDPVNDGYPLPKMINFGVSAKF